MRRKNIKEEIVELLFFIGSATREQITLLLSNNIREEGGKLTGEKKDSVNKALIELKKETYDVKKVEVGKKRKKMVKEYKRKNGGRVDFVNNHSNAKETYFLTFSHLQRYGYYDTSKIDFEKNYECVDFIIKKKMLLEQKMGKNINIKDFFNFYVSTNYNKANQINKKIDEVDVVVSIPNEEGKEELHTFIYINGDIQEQFNLVLEFSKKKNNEYKGFIFTKTKYGYESNIYRIKIRELMESYTG